MISKTGYDGRRIFETIKFGAKSFDWSMETASLLSVKTARCVG
jgi:hypothetical protein